MLKKLKNILRNWLFFDEIHQLQTVIHNQSQMKEYVDEARRCYQTAANSLHIAHDAVAKCLDVGVDVNLRSPSWAVICVKGKPETVRFMELDHHGAERLRMFLKSMEGSCMIVDSPFSKHFYDWK